MDAPGNKATNNCIPISSPESMDENSESEHSGGSNPPSECSSPDPTTHTRDQKRGTALPTAINTAASRSSIASTSSSTPSRSSSSQTPSPSSSFINAARIHPSDSAVMVPPYSANPNSRAKENHLPLSQVMQLITLQNPSQRVNYPFLQPTLQGPHLPLPPLPPHYDSISKHPPPPPLTSIQQNAFRGIGVGSVNPKLQSSTAGQNFHVPSGVMVSADLMPKHSGQPPHSHGVAPTDSFQQKKAVINHLVGYERLGQAQGPPQPKAEMGVVPIMSTATSLPLQFPSVPIMGSEAPSRVGGIDLNGSRCPRSRKRMLSQSGQLPPGAELAGDAEFSVYPPLMRDTMFPGAHVPPVDGGSEANASQSQHLKWQAHMVDTWHDVCDGALQDIPQIDFHVETDKGFNYSIVDDAFVCQKKNHFQVTVQVQFQRIPKFLKMKDGSIQPIENFTVYLHGVKFEQTNCVITLEQSLTDRSKRKFVPTVLEVPTKCDEPCKITICRLHFSETTANNMRKRGKPNPDQKHFSLVVALHAVTPQGTFTVVQHVSERIIVRASNPGNFDNECDYAWLRAANPDIVFHNGRVGINTDKPEEALAVNGSIQLTGQILKVSDARVKRNITRADPKQQLETVSRFQLYEYQFADGTAWDPTGEGPGKRRVGLLAQEVKNLIPEAVKETHSDVTLTDGAVVSNLLMVDESRILMETVGAVQELKRIAGKLEKRLDKMEEERTKFLQPCSCCSHLNKTKNINGQWGRNFIITIVFGICSVLFLVSMLLILSMHMETSAHSNSSRASSEVENMNSGQFIGTILQYWLHQ